MAINLLPKDISKENRVNQRGKSLGVLAYSLFAIGIFVMIGGAGLVYVTQQSVNSLKKQQQELIAEAANYQEQETQLVLINDRLELINDVLSSEDLGQIRDQHKLLYDNMPEGLRLFQQTLSESESSFTVESSGSLALRDYLRRISDMEEFSSLEIGQMRYNPSVGYQVELQVE